MWRSYEKGEREFCGIQLEGGLSQDCKLANLLMTPSTKGILKGIPNVAEADDVNITRQNILDNYTAFNFEKLSDVSLYEKFLTEGFSLISEALAELGQVFVDTKFEFGYVKDLDGNNKLIYMDEVGTPDSSRIWDAQQYEKGNVVENSKEGFRQLLLNHFPDPDILLNKERMPERQALAKDNALPVKVLMQVSKTYIDIAEKITDKPLVLSENPKAEIIQILQDNYQLVD
jgi:phosphoribosylaminoimidazole-succinocarboxamide synthase